MNVLTYNPDAMTKSTVIPLGRACECRATRIDFTVSAWLARFPGGEIALYVKDPNGEAYLATITTKDGMASWVLNNTDTQVSGYGSLELALIGANGERKLSAVATTKIEPSLVEAELTEQPEYMQPWIERAAEIQAKTETAAREAATHAEAAYNSADAAAKAQAAATTSADAAAKAQSAADEAARAAGASAAEAVEAVEAQEGESVKAVQEAATQAAQEAVEAVEVQEVESVKAVQDAAARVAPAIVQEASGSVVSIADAAAMPVLALVSTITAAQAGEGNPSPENVRLLTGWQAANLYHGAAYDASASPVLAAALPEIVWGGTLDWATGLLTITHFVQTFDGTEAWTSTTAGSYQLRDDTLHSKTVSTNTDVRHVCSHFKADRYRAFTSQVNNTCYELNNNRVNVKCTSIATLEDWTAYLAAQAAAGTPMTIVWEYLPNYHTTVQLTPQQLTLLKGSNAMWSDTGDTALTYIADTKMYIDNVAATLAASILNA